MVDILDQLSGSGNFYVAIGGAVGSYLLSRFTAKKDKNFTEKQTKELLMKERLNILKYQNMRARFDDLVSHKIAVELDKMKSELYNHCERLIQIEEHTSDVFINVSVKNYTKQLTPRQAFLDYHDGLKRAFKVCQAELKDIILYDDIKGKNKDELLSSVSDTSVSIHHLFLITVAKSAGSCDLFKAAEDRLSIDFVMESIGRVYDFALRHSGYITDYDAKEDILTEHLENE